LVPHLEGVGIELEVRHGGRGLWFFGGGVEVGSEVEIKEVIVL
jgi:hypothetical protein